MIDRFINENAFLSNFFPSTFRWKGQLWKTVEHAYAASKTLDSKQFEMIRNASTPAKAKSLGRSVIIREDWDDVKISVMEELLELKFENPFLRAELLKTGARPLIETNHWNDTFWGICKGKGENNLGRLLMELRTKIESNPQ